MKNKIYPLQLLLFGSIFIISNSIVAQSVGTGRIEAGFGVDADLAADTALNGSAASGSGKPSDDWFWCPNVKSHLSGLGIIDTSGAAALKAQLQASAIARENLIFSKPMALPKLTRSGGYILLDALYAKDHVNNDKSTITSPGTKIIDDPGTWTFGQGNPQTKDDILEFYSHVRRKGITVDDSLFFYFGVGIYGTAGNKNVTAELFVNDVKYDTITKTLTNLGNQGGRVAWEFDQFGNVKKIGDMIISMGYSPSGGGNFSIHPRIWVRNSTYDSFRNVTPLFLSPANFELGTKISQGGSSSSYGYADIEPKSGPGSEVAQGTSNNVNTCLAAPWGTISSNSGYPWSSFYNIDQFVELSINLTALGVDPSLFAGIDPCTVPYRSIIFYSTSSTAANSNPKDFAGPYPFWRYPRVISDIKGADTLTCTKTTGSIFADSAYGLAWYKWTAMNGGNIVSYNSDSTAITYDAPGKYILESAPLRGCFTKKDSVTIFADLLKPIASAEAYDSLILASVYKVKLHGGDSAASIIATNSMVFGPSKGIGFNWTGPLGYTANVMQPLATEMGSYFLTVTELRNGCIDTASTVLVLLPVELSELNCQVNNDKIMLNWIAFSETGIFQYLVERECSKGRTILARLDASASKAGNTYYIYTDDQPDRGINAYRITAISQTGVNLASIQCMGSNFNPETKSISIFPNPANAVIYLSLNYPIQNATYSIYQITGELVAKGNLSNSNQMNIISLNNLPSGSYIINCTGSEFHESLRFIHQR